MKSRLYTYEKRALRRLIAAELLQLLPLCAVCGALVWTAICEPLMLILYIPLLSFAAVTYVALVVKLYRRTVKKGAPRARARIRAIPDEHRAELDEELRTGDVLKLGDMAFCSRYIFLRSTCVFIPYERVVACHCVDRVLWHNGMKSASCGVYIRVKGESTEYSTAMTAKEYPHRHGLYKKLTERVTTANREIDMWYRHEGG